MTDEKIQSFTHENVNLRSSSNNYLSANHTDKDVYLSVREFSGNSIGGQSTRPSNQNVFDIPTYLKNYENLQRKLMEDQDSGRNYIQIVRSNLGQTFQQTFQQNFQQRLKSESQKKLTKSSKKSAKPKTNLTGRKKKLGKDIVKRYEREFGKVRNLHECELYKAGIDQRYHHDYPTQSQNKSLPWPRKKSGPKSALRHSTSKKSIPRKPEHSNPAGHKIFSSLSKPSQLQKPSNSLIPQPKHDPNT